MIAVALWVASLPGAVGRIAAFGAWPLLVGTLGLAVICLLKTPLRWTGTLLVVVGSLWAVATTRPDVLVAADARAIAVRTATGVLSISATGGDSFATRAWLAADGDGRTANAPDLSDGVTCDAAGCIARLADGRLVAHVRAPEAFAEDCAHAAIVVTAREAPPGCNALVIDRKVWRPAGAIAVYRNGAALTLMPTRPPGSDRPWARGLSTTDAVVGRPSVRPAARDATPRAEDREAGD
jgi:competence protein ComEC